MTFPQGYNAASLKSKNILVTRVSDENYLLGIEEVSTPSGYKVRTYSVERSLCDMLRGNKGEIQIIQPAMKKYVQSRSKDINKLMKYAKQLRVEKKVRNYLEVLL